VKLPLQSTEHI